MLKLSISKLKTAAGKEQEVRVEPHLAGAGVDQGPERRVRHLDAEPDKAQHRLVEDGAWHREHDRDYDRPQRVRG
jgi:hypothetical protein